MANVVKWKDKYTSLRKRLTRAQAAAKEGTTRGMLTVGETVLAGGGGALAGVLNSRYPTLRGQNTVTAATLIGAATSLGAAVITVTAKDRDSTIAGAMAGSFGNGVLAGDVAVKTFLASEKKKK